MRNANKNNYYLNTDVSLPSNKNFGLFFTILIGLIGGYASFQNQANLSYILVFICLALFAVTILAPEKLSHPNELWFRFGLLIGRIVSPLVLGIIFFGIFTPISLITRLFGRDELDRQIKEKETYWKTRNVGVDSLSSFERQF
jgi:hypothetical protein